MLNTITERTGIAEDRVLEADVVVIGSGAGGMTAAIVAADAGLSVILLEKTEFFGGTTARSAGAIDVPCNHHMAKLEQVDTREEAELYLRNVAGNYYNAAIVDAFLDNAPAMLLYMETHSEVKVDEMMFPDYEPWQPGMKFGRMVNPLPYDARKLGNYQQKLRPPLAHMTLFNGLQLRTIEIGDFLEIRKSRKAFINCMKLMMPFFYQKLRYGRGTRLAMGNALAGRLLKSCIDRKNITLIDRGPVQRLLHEGERVSGAIFEKDGQEWQANARSAVILATGGFSANPAMRNQYLTQAQDGLTLQPPGNDGDGIRIGLDEGGSFITANMANGNWTPVSVLIEKDGTRKVYPHFILDRHTAGSLTVGPDGKRFVNESINYQLFCKTMHERKIDRCYVIADHQFVRRFGFGMVHPWPMPLRPFIDRGYIVKGQTLAELARKIKIDPAVLEATVKQFNGYAEAGKDPDFKRGDDIYSAILGGGTGPNPGLAPVTKGPYYALEMRPGDFGSVAGLKIDAQGRVLAGEETPVPGLYAVGTTANSVFGGAYPTGGANIGPAMTFGYIASRHIAANQ